VGGEKKSMDNLSAQAEYSFRSSGRSFFPSEKRDRVRGKKEKRAGITVHRY